VTPSHVLIETRFAKGRLTDMRTLEDDDATMKQVLELHVKGGTAPIVTRRFMKRVAADVG